MQSRTIGLIGFDGVTALDLVGPMEAFSSSRLRLPAAKGGEQPAYRLLILGVDGRPFRATSGATFLPDAALDAAPPLDTLIVAGGLGLRDMATNHAVAAWIRKHAGRIRRIASVCTGIYGLAPTGLLDGRRVTTHWEQARDVAARFPALKVEPNAIFIRDGKFITSAGATSSIDLSLALIEEDHGPALSLAVARQLVVYLKRPGGQEQYSEPLAFQVRAQDPLADLVTWMRAHLDRDLAVEVLARRAHLSPRQFTRRFKEALGLPPAAFVERLRLDEARQRLRAPDTSIEEVAASLGFPSGDTFRRAFERRFLLSPSAYRGRFSSAR